MELMACPGKRQGPNIVGPWSQSATRPAMGLLRGSKLSWTRFIHGRPPVGITVVCLANRDSYASVEIYSTVLESYW